jgi:hypothetical protein
MGNINHEEGISKNNTMLLLSAGAVYVVNLIFYALPCVDLLSAGRDICSLPLVDKIGKSAFFSHPLFTLLFAMLIFGLYAWGKRHNKTTKYIPPRIMLWIISLMVSLKIHPQFEWEEITDRNGKKRQQKRRERVEGQFTLFVGMCLTLISVLPISIIPSTSFSYIFAYVAYVLLSGFGVAYFLLGADLIHSMTKDYELEDNDSNNDLQESFMQESVKLSDEYSVNWRTEFKYQGKVHNGWINLVNPFRATQVIGTPGSGKSFAVINEVISQHLAKGFCMYCYDFKFPDLSTIVYNHMLWHSNNFLKKYGVQQQFCVINFDDPRKSYRCNPIDANFMEEITDAYDSAYTIMLNLNKSWAQKQGDFFVESPINYLTSCIWYLKNVEGGKYCTLPHVVELVNSSYTDCIPLMSVYPELNNYMAAFFEAWEGGAQDQLQGQIASVRIPLSRISSPALYWVMTGNDFTLDLNNPEEPKVLCVGNNPEKKDIYATALGLYNGRIVKIINKKNKHKITLIIDELPTMYFRGLDNLIATARSNKVATVLGYQDFSQLKRDYGDKEATAIINTIGNTFAGLVTGETAQSLEKQFGRNKQKRKSVSLSDSGESVSISEQNDTIIPASKIATLTQGNFVGTISDNFGQEIQEKRFFAKILLDTDKIKQEERLYRPLPVLYSFDGHAEAVRIRDLIIEYLSDPSNHMLNVVLSANKLPDREVIAKSFPDARKIEVSRLMSLIITEEGSKNHRMLSFLSRYGKDMRREVITFMSNLNVSFAKFREDKESLRQHLLSNFGEFENAIRDYLEAEKQELRKKSLDVSHSIAARLDRAVDDLNSGAISEQGILSLVDNMSDFTKKFAYLEVEVQKIRDEKMKAVLEKNSEKVRQEIKDLIKTQLQHLYFTDRDGLWLRRLKANKLKEVDELIRIGLQEEADKLMQEDDE